jgi:hypothetical protein
MRLELGLIRTQRKLDIYCMKLIYKLKQVLIRDYEACKTIQVKLCKDSEYQ